MNRLTILSVVAVIMLVGSQGYQILDKYMSPEGTTPWLAVTREGVLRYSYVPHWSIIRTASSWYDRKVELYVGQDNGLNLSSCLLNEYNYPIFAGKLQVEAKDCM